MGYLCANFSLPRHLCSRLRPDVRDRRQTDRCQTHVRRAPSLNAPTKRAGHNKRITARLRESQHITEKMLSDLLVPGDVLVTQNCRQVARDFVRRVDERTGCDQHGRRQWTSHADYRQKFRDVRCQSERHRTIGIQLTWQLINTMVYCN